MLTSLGWGPSLALLCPSSSCPCPTAAAIALVVSAVDLAASSYRPRPAALDLPGERPRLADCNSLCCLQKVTATGCSVTALIAAFLAANPELPPLEAAAYTLAYFG